MDKVFSLENKVLRLVCSRRRACGGDGFLRARRRIEGETQGILPFGEAINTHSGDPEDPVDSDFIDLGFQNIALRLRSGGWVVLSRTNGRE
jgi:hypothetical protein